MTAKQALGTVLLWGVAFSVVGGLVGGTLGALTPEYYRGVFRGGQAAEFNPVQVGVGLGVTQGLASGIALALGVLALMAWRDVRNANVGRTPETAESDKTPRRWMVRAFAGLIASVAVVLLCSVVFVLGGIVGQGALYQTWTERKLDKLETILAAEEFANLQFDYSSAAQVYVVGSVQDERVRAALRERLVSAFGTEEAEFMLLTVDVGE